MKLKEALPKPGQSPLGGVSPEQTKIQVQGFGTLNYGQVLKEVENYLNQISVDFKDLKNGSSFDDPEATGRSALKNDQKKNRL